MCCTVLCAARRGAARRRACGRGSEEGAWALLCVRYAHHLQPLPATSHAHKNKNKKGVPALKQWLGGWLARYGQVAAAVTGVAVTPYSNKVLLAFRLLLVDASGGGSSLNSGDGGKGGVVASPTAAAPVDVEGALLYVYNIAGAVTHLVVWRNGTPDEMKARFVGAGGGGGVGVGGGGSVSVS